MTNGEPLPMSNPSPEQPATFESGNRDVRIDSLLLALKDAEDRYDAGAVELVNLTVEREAESDAQFDRGITDFAGKYLAELVKAEKRFDRAQHTFEVEGLAALTDAELERDQYGRDAGGNPPQIIGQIFEAARDNRLGELADQTMIEPMVRAALMEEYQVPPPAPVWTPDAPPISDTAVSPEFGGILEPSFSPPVPPPAPTPTPTTCPPPSTWGLQFVGPVTRPGDPPPMGDYEIGFTDPVSGCIYWRLRAVTTLPPPPRPTVPPPPPASSCDPPNETVKVDCIQLAFPWVSKWWYTARCLPGCATEICTWRGPVAPSVDSTWTVYGPYDVPLTGGDLDDLARDQCKRAGTAPPLPPIVPPGIPPAPVPPGEKPPPAQVPPGERPPGQQPPAPPIDLKRPTNDDIAALCGEVQGWITAANGGRFGDAGTVWSTAFTNWQKGEWGDGIFGNIASAVLGLNTVVLGGVSQLLTLAQVDNATAMGTILGPLALLGWGERITGAPMSYLGEEWQQYMRYAAPMFLPSQAAVDGQFVAGVINEEEWRCLTRFNGNKTEHARRTVEAGRVRPDVLAVISLRRRNVINQAQYLAAMRELGVLRDEDRVRFEKATELTPQVSDIFRYIKRDVSNKEFVELGKLDEGFPEAYNGEMKAFGDAIGLSELQAKYEYRAEWEFPARTEATEMFRRLRPGRKVEVEQVLPDGSLQVVRPEPFTIADYLQVLKVNDVAPGFRERALAVSYVPISLTDIKALNKNQVIDKKEVVERLQDIGKSPADAEVLAELVVRDNARMLSNETGGWTRRKTFKEYRDGTITRVVASEILARTIPSAQTVNQILDDADLDREVQSRRECIRGVARRYNVAEIDEGRAVFELTNLGMTEDQASVIVDGWRCKRSSRAREPKVEMLQRWWAQGIISTNDLYVRLTRLGFSHEDATRIAQSTIVKEEEKRAAEVKKAAEKAKREADAKARRDRAEQRQRLRDAARMGMQPGGGEGGPV